MNKLKEEDRRKAFSVTLDREYVKKAKEIMDKEGRKLSPVLNNLLIKWVEEQKSKEESKS